MGHIHIEWLAQGELGGVVIVGRVDAGVTRVNQLSFESSCELQDVADALGTASRGAECEVAIVLDVDIIGEVLPLLFGEQGAEE